MANPTCELCKALGVTCEDNRYQEIPPFSSWQFANRTVRIAAKTITATIHTFRPIEDCPATTNQTVIQSTAEGWIKEARELSK